MSSPFDADRAGTALDEALADQRLDPFRPRDAAQNDPYIIGPASMPQEPDPNPWLTGGK